VLPASELGLDSLAFLAATDNGEAAAFGDGGEQLVVLAEGEIVDGGARRERDRIDVEHDPAARPLGDVRRVGADAVRDVEQRMRRQRQPLPLVEPQRRTGVALLPERGAGGAERAGDDEQIARYRAAAARNPLGAAERGHAQHELRRADGVAADDRDARLPDPLVQLDDVRDGRLRRRAERDDEAAGVGARGREVAQVDGGGAEAELAPRDPGEPEVDSLDERVLGDDEAVDLRGVVGDPLGEAAPLELGQQAELADLIEP
jgi:hypothetical protein